MDLRERKKMGLSRYKSKICVVFLSDLEVIVSEFESKIYESLSDLINVIDKKMFKYIKKKDYHFVL